MKKFIILLSLILCANSCMAKVISNEPINQKKLQFAKSVIRELQKDVVAETENGKGPFVAAIYDKNGNLIVKVANSVVEENCSNNHAEMNAIREAEKKLGTYDLSKYDLSLYVTSEPCIMCLGGIMWSGIKEVYYGVSSKNVEKITGFDEGFKPNWFKEFKNRGIVVYGNIDSKYGEEVLRNYVKTGKKVYKPERQDECGNSK